MIENSKVYDLQLPSNDYVMKVKNMIPIVISITPYLENEFGVLQPLSNIIDILENEGCDVLLEKYQPSFGFSLFRKKDDRRVYDLFMGDKQLCATEFIKPSLDILMEIIGKQGCLEDILETHIYDEIRDVHDAHDFIEYINDSINDLFNHLNKNKSIVDKWFESRYEILGSLIQTNYVFNNIESPDTILDFDGKSCGIFKTVIATTYFLPNGL